MANKIVAGEVYYDLDGQLAEIKRQLRQQNGYPFDPVALKHYLQDAIEGRFSLGDFFRETGELTIDIPALPRPTIAKLQAKFPWIKSIERDTSPTGPVTLKLGTVLRPGEERINGDEYERRLLTQKLDIALGYQQWNWVFEHQSEYPDLIAFLGKIYIDFPGLIVVRGDGSRHIPYLSQGGKRFAQSWYCLSYAFYRLGRVAVSGK